MPKAPFVREKFTKEHTAARELAKDISNTIRRIDIRQRSKLAQSAVGKYRIHHEAAA